MIHKMMDTTAKRRYSMGRTSIFSKNCRETSIIERRTSPKPKKTCCSFSSSNSENRVSDFKVIKPCFVKLDKICDTQLSKLLANRMYSNMAQSNRNDLEMTSLQSTDMIHNPTENLRPDDSTGSRVNININPEFLATEDHLDLLMAKEMASSYPQTDKRINGRVKHVLTNSLEDCNLNPVVVLKRLSPQFISRAINGKLEMECGEFNQRKKRRGRPPLQKLAVTNGPRRSERLSNILLSTEDQNSYFFNRRNSCSTRRQYKIKDDKKRIRNKENISRAKKRSNEKINNSDDEEEFYGFENQTKNRQRIKKMKEALKTLNAQPLGKERPRILKVKEPLKNFYPRPSGKENGRAAIFNGDFKSLIRHKAPFKAVNRVDASWNTNEDIVLFNNPNIEDDQSSISYRDSNLNVRNKVIMLHRNNVQCNDSEADGSALDRLEILELFKKREKLLINKMVRDQGKIIVSKTGELFNEDTFSDEPLNYYSGKYYIKKIGRRIPLWAEESIRNVIIQSQDQIPLDIIGGYFQDPDLTDPTCIAEFLGSAFLEKNDIAINAW
ncbi:unnamed protein product [Nezara viridula]|uniref:Uncharacterized protein n=1 Tax=Nezara viridula TaxID=85310 RepID=A0A9P0H831_NEZVI|nr:unnamed protein product [Nezara viridula]